MKTPHVNAVGILEYPEDYLAHPRFHSAPVRIFAALVLGAFVLAGLTTSVVSLAAYCLTSHAGIPFPFVE